MFKTLKEFFNMYKVYKKLKEGNMPEAIKYILDRLDEPSTWKGIIALLATFGVSIHPELAQAIITAAVSVVGVIEILVNEKAKK